jgi:hypothetical protein
MSRDITKAHPLLQEFVPKAQTWYAAKYPGSSLVVTHVDRTQLEQLRLFLQARLPDDDLKKLSLPISSSPVTWKDGFVNKSKHNVIPSHAIDFGIKKEGKFDWSDEAAKTLASCVMDTGYIGRIKWGGIFEDCWHFQIKD